MTRKDIIKTASKLNKKHGWLLVPQKPDKKHPVIKWKGLQDQKATPDSTKELFKDAPAFDGICLVTGRNSGVYVVDCDNKAGLEVCKKYLPKPDYVAKTKRGFHLYYKAPQGALTNRTNILGADKEAGEPVIDIRAENGIAVLYLNENDYKFKAKTPFPAKEIERMIKELGNRKSTSLNVSKKRQPAEGHTVANFDDLDELIGSLAIDYETQAKASLAGRSKPVEMTCGGKKVEWKAPKPPSIEEEKEYLRKDDLEVIKALKCIPPDCVYDEWRNIGACIKYKFGKENGFQIFDCWSSKSEKHGPNCTTYSWWNSLDPITTGTLINIAKRYGYIKS